MEKRCDVHSAICGMQQAIVIASAFFSQVAYSRRVLPAVCFGSVRIGKNTVKAVKIPSPRYTCGLHKAIYSWLIDDLRVAISTLPHFTASIILHGEAYQVRVEKHVSQSSSTCRVSEDDLLSTVQSMLRSLRLYIVASPSYDGDDDAGGHNAQYPLIPMLDIGEGIVDLTTSANMEEDLFEKKVVDDKEGVPTQVCGLKRNVSLGLVETSSVVMEFIYCSS